MALLPASPAARKAEEAIRERARTEAFDRGYAHGKAYGNALLRQEAGSNAPSPAGLARGQDPAIQPRSGAQDLALAIGQDQILLPPVVIVSRTLNDEGAEVATAIRVGRLTFTIEEAVRLGVLTPDGRFSHYRAGVLLHSTPEPGAWVRPSREAEIPGRPRA
jgi:hypothetical protein